MMRKILMTLAILLAIATGAWATGELSGIFSVSATKKVQFSKGNLQYTKSTGVWSFMEHQYSTVETTGSYCTNDYGNRDVVSLFGWATSGYNHGATCYQPYSTNANNDNYYAYGNASYNLYDQTGQADWGYNAISNGGNTENSGWRTLTTEEWQYLFANHTKGWSTVNGVNGYVIRPDGVSTAIAASYSASDWATEEAAGAVFLPAAGYRNSYVGTDVYDKGSIGRYWSSSADGSNANYVNFSNSSLGPGYTMNRKYGLSVRLVKDVPTYNASFASGNDNDGWTIDPTQQIEGGTVTVSYSGEHKVKSVSVTNKYAIAHSLATAVVGDIVGSDGNAYSVAEKDKLPVGVTAEAVVCYKSGSNGLAVALVNLSGTFGHTEAVDYTGSNYTGFCTAHPVSGQTWKVLSQDEFSNVYNACGGTAPTAIYPADGYSGNRGSLDTYITNAGGTAMSGNYWTATTYTGAENCFVCTNILSGNVCNFNYNNTTYKLNVRYGFTF